MIEPDNEARLYIIMFMEVADMNPGKTAAQACHAQSLADTKLAGQSDYEAWRSQAGGFGTTIVLEGTAGNFSEAVAEMYVDNQYMAESDEYPIHHFFSVVVDPSYPYRNYYGDLYFDAVVTCAYFFARNADDRKFMKPFKLHR